MIWFQLLKMYAVGDKLLNGMKGKYVNILARIRVKWGESKQFRIDSGVPLVFQCIYRCSDEGGENAMVRRGVRF